MPSRYRFHGQAIAAGGRIHHPFHEFIEIQAALALPEVGGHGTAHSSNFRYRDLLRFEHAHTEVTGTEATGLHGKPVHKSLMRTRVEGLDIGGVVTADRVEARLVSFTEEDKYEEPCFKLTGSYFENLRIAGVPVKVHLAANVFDTLPRHSDVAQSYKKKGAFRTLYQELTLKKRPEHLPAFDKLPERVQNRFQQAPEHGDDLPHIGGMTCLSLVRSIQPEREEFECHGHVVYIEGFGTIHLAELVLSGRHRRLTMISVNLGSPVSGDVQVCTAEGNGSPY